MDAERELEREISRVGPGTHLCLVYNDEGEQFAAVIPYIKAGLARGERCGYIVDDRSVEEVVAALSRAGVDVAGEESRGALVILSKRDAYLRSGVFEPEAMIAFLREMIERALADGFTGLCVTGEMTWALGPETGNERLIEYENQLNRLLVPGSHGHAVCQYNRRRFEPVIIRDVLRTHPFAVVGGLVCPNVFYEPPDMMLGRRSIAEETTWRIEQLKSARATARALERAEAAQRLLSEATSLLVSSLDHRTTLQALARLVVPDLSDWCAIDLVGEDGSAGDVVALAHSDPAREQLARANHRQRSPRRDDATGGLAAALGWRSTLIAPLSVRGEAIGTMSLAMAESDRRFGDEDRTLVAELARRTAIAVDNARLFRQAHEAIAARDEFLLLASHELRTPLTTLKLQVELFDREALDLVDDAALPRFRDQVARLRRQGDRLEGLVQEILEISRIVGGGFMMTPETLDLSRVVAQVLAAKEGEAQAARCEVRVELEPNLVGRWDHARLCQIVSNLVSNALKYGAGRPVSVTTRAAGGEAVLVVSDQGIGVAPNDQERIFGRFERAVSLWHYGGLGLGLFITRQAIEAMGGTIALESVPGRGATFTVSLPRTPAGIERPASDAGASTTHASTPPERAAP